MAREAAVEGERGLGLRGVPRGVAHAVAPRVEVGLLHGVLVFIKHLLPTAEVVGEHVVEASGAVLVDVHGHDLAFGVDIVETSGGGGRGFELIEIRYPGLLLDERLSVGDYRMLSFARRVVVEGDVVAVLIKGLRPVAQVVGENSFHLMVKLALIIVVYTIPPNYKLGGD